MFHQRGVRRARFRFVEPSSCNWGDCPGSDDTGCYEGTLELRARWVGYGPITKETQVVDGTTYMTRTRAATTSGRFTFDGEVYPASTFDGDAGLLRVTKAL